MKTEEKLEKKEETIFLEYFYNKIAKSPYQENFILKGGLSYLGTLGIEYRSDRDGKLSEDSLKRLLDSIFKNIKEKGFKVTIKKVIKVKSDGDTTIFQVTIIFKHGKKTTFVIYITEKEIKSSNIESKVINCLNEEIESKYYKEETLLASRFCSFYKNNKEKKDQKFNQYKELVDIDRIFKTSKRIEKSSLGKEIIETLKLKVESKTNNNQYKIIGLEILNKVNSIKENPLTKKEWEVFKKKNNIKSDLNISELSKNLNPLYLALEYYLEEIKIEKVIEETKKELVIEFEKQKEKEKELEVKEKIKEISIFSSASSFNNITKLDLENFETILTIATKLIEPEKEMECLLKEKEYVSNLNVNKKELNSGNIKLNNYANDLKNLKVNKHELSYDEKLNLKVIVNNFEKNLEKFGYKFTVKEIVNEYTKQIEKEVDIEMD